MEYESGSRQMLYLRSKEAWFLVSALRRTVLRA